MYEYDDDMPEMAAEVDPQKVAEFEPKVELTFTYEPSAMVDSIALRVANILADRIERTITADVKISVQRKLDERVTAIVDEALSRDIQPVNEWGEPKGNKTNVREMIIAKAQTFMTEKVDSDGRPSTYNGTPRMEVATRKIVNEVLNHHMRTEIEKAAKAARAEIETKVGAMIAAAAMPKA